MADALAVILKHEEIQYSHGVGPGCICLETWPKEEKRVKKALSEWLEAVSALHQQLTVKNNANPL
jgi:hypothetical protein